MAKKKLRARKFWIIRFKQTAKNSEVTITKLGIQGKAVARQHTWGDC